MKKIIAFLLCMVCMFSVMVGCEIVVPESVPGQNETPMTPILPDDSLNTPGEPNVPDIPQEPGEPNVPDAPEPPKPEPPPPPKPTVQKTTMVMAVSSNVTVRSGAGTSFKAVGQLDSGDRLKYIITNNGWFEVYFKGVKAYVSAIYSVLVSFETNSSAVEKVINVGEKYLGTTYVFGAERYHWGNGSLNSKFSTKQFDCSSLTQYMLKIGANINIATTSREQSLQGKTVSRANLKRGDLMFFTNSSRYNNVGLDRIGHVGVYLGDNYILHTASDYAVIEPISAQRWAYLINSRRLIS